jgi:hypothetical protein
MTGELSRWSKGRIATAGVVAATVLSLVGCAQQGIAVAQPRFDTVPDDCAFALAPARTEIARFAGDLREPDDDIETDHDSERHDTALHVRCWEIFNGTHRAPLDADEVGLHRSTRDLWISFTVFAADEAVTDPVGEAKRRFDTYRPPGSSVTTGIGEAAYTVTQNIRPPWLLPGTVAGSVEIYILISNLIVQVKVGGINVGDSTDPSQLSSDLAGHATPIATTIAANIDAAMT